MSDKAAKIRAGTVLVTALAFAAGSSFTPAFGGFDPGDFPNPIQDLPLTPAGYAFAIWGPIFLALILGAIFGLYKRVDDPVWDSLRVPLIICQTLGAGWVGLAILAPVWATIVIWIMLAMSLIALLRARKSNDIWQLRVPLGLLAGWLTAASWVALTTSLVGHISWLDPIWASWFGLIGALVLALIVLHRFGGLAYGIAVIWALVGIIFANLGQPGALTIGAGLGIASILLATLRPRSPT